MRDSELFTAVTAEGLTGGAVVRFSAEGASMHPAIRHGEVITVATVSPNEVIGGDVLLYRNDGRVLAHRVVEVITLGTERVFLLRGDAGGACDGPVRAKAVIGKVVAVSRNGREVPAPARGRRLRRAARVSASRARALIVTTMSLLARSGEP